MSIIKTNSQLTAEDEININKRITVGPTKHKDGKATAPSSSLFCSDGTEFDPLYEDKAFNHERLLWIREQLVVKYKQTAAPKEYWRIIANSMQCQGAFKGCYQIYIPDNTLATLKEIEYLHDQIRRTGIILPQLIETHGPGWYIISYGEIDKYGLHQLDAEEVLVTPVKHILAKMAQLQITLQNLLEHGE